MKFLRTLVSLFKGYGLGDAVQMSAVLRHLQKHRPNWIIDYQAEPGRHEVGRGIVNSTFAYGDTYPSDHYDVEVQILLYDTWANWHDRPNTRVSSCLHERFGLDWDPECGGYFVEVPLWARQIATAIIPHRAVALHYQGDSSPDRKNLSHDQAREICDCIRRLNFKPLLLDWRNQWALQHEPQTVSVGGYSFSQEWGRGAHTNCAVISMCSAFVGIDSGPSKCASATDTPSLVVWTGHHPAPFHDPAPNTTHLVPENYHGLYPVCNDVGVIKWFESNHKVIKYKDDPVKQIKGWLMRTLQ